jgi:hypothetical protein
MIYSMRSFGETDSLARLGQVFRDASVALLNAIDVWHVWHRCELHRVCTPLDAPKFGAVWKRE